MKNSLKARKIFPLNRFALFHLLALRAQRTYKTKEALVKGDLIKLLKERNVDVQGIAREHERVFNGKDYEVDIIAINGDEVVVVEVKTTLKLSDVKHFTSKLKIFKQVFREYADKDIYQGRPRGGAEAKIF